MTVVSQTNLGSWNASGWRAGPDVSNSPRASELLSYGYGLPTATVFSYEFCRFGVAGYPDIAASNNITNGPKWMTLGTSPGPSYASTVYYQDRFVPTNAKTNGSPPDQRDEQGRILTIQTNWAAVVQFDVTTNVADQFIYIFGYDIWGQKMQETIPTNTISANVLLGQKAFWGITGIWLPDGITLSASWSGIFGLPYAMLWESDYISWGVLSVNIPYNANLITRAHYYETNGQVQLPPTPTSGDVRGTIDMRSYLAADQSNFAQFTYLCRGASSWDMVMNVLGENNPNIPTRPLYFGVSDNPFLLSGVPQDATTMYGYPQFYVGYPA